MARSTTLPERLLRALLATLALLCALPASAERFVAIVTHVSDGDTLWVRRHAQAAPIQLRLEGLDAPEICQDHGPAARAALAGLVLHRTVVVTTRARDRFDRSVARVRFSQDDTGRWMVRHGHAWSHRFRRSGGPYAAEEALARGGRLGLWAHPAPLQPRIFRKGHGACHTG
ncbi:MAG: thermonuclease family protein [Comamonadaceae bacterium]|nr:MAG: thermonuclease family protein [Comamonadaceae bacterium]